ncbi:MAG: helix-turn-helix domain-containing protein [Cytophagaceae bacterium]
MIIDHYAKAYPIFGRIQGFYSRRFQDMRWSLRKFSESEVAEQRLKIIKFYEQYGEKAMKKAFGADRKIISKWRKRLKDNGGSLTALIPQSTRPHNVRKPQTHQEVVSFIKGIRQKYPRIGKQKIKPLLYSYCKEQGIKSVSESTIGNIIKRHKLYYPNTSRIYHDPNSKWAENQAKRKKRLKIKHPIKPNEFGHIVSDTVERVTNGVRDYFISAIDAKLKFALTINYKRLTSRNVKDFYERFKKVYPLTVKSGRRIMVQRILRSLMSRIRGMGCLIIFPIPIVLR